MASVVVIGSSNTDLVVRTPHIPAPGETIIGGDLARVSGGKGANQAVAAARLGARVTFVGRIGTDMFGEGALRDIGAAGVDTRFIVRDPDAPSGVALICVAEGGENSIVVAPGANARLRSEDVDAAIPAIRAANTVVLQLEIPLVTVEHAIALARREGKRVILNPAPARTLPDELLRQLDVLTPNEIEAAMLLGLPPGHAPDPKEATSALLERGVRAVVLTLGEAGALVATRGKVEDRVERVPAPRVEAVDTTAAGDCFTGALACSLAEGSDILTAARFACAAASLSVTRFGAQTSMPDRVEVESFARKS